MCWVTACSGSYGDWGWWSRWCWERTAPSTRSGSPSLFRTYLYLGLQSKSRQRIPAADAPSAQRWVDSVDITALCTVARVSVSATRYLDYLCLHCKPLSLQDFFEELVIPECEDASSNFIRAAIGNVRHPATSARLAVKHVLFVLCPVFFRCVFWSEVWLWLTYQYCGTIWKSIFCAFGFWIWRTRLVLQIIDRYKWILIFTLKKRDNLFLPSPRLSLLPKAG